MDYVNWAVYLMWHPWDTLKRYMERQIKAWSDAVEQTLALPDFPPQTTFRQFVKTGMLFNFWMA